MTSDEKAVLLIVGNYAGSIAKTSPALTGHDTGIAGCLTHGWIVDDSAGHYLMGTVGENALAAAINTD